MQQQREHKNRGVLSFAALLAACGTSAYGVVTYSSNGPSGPNALQIPSVQPSSPWRLTYDPSTPPELVTTLAAKGLYSNEFVPSATNINWANTAENLTPPVGSPQIPAGIQLLLPHPAPSATVTPVLGNAATNVNATFLPNGMDGSTRGIDTISFAIGARKTSTSTDNCQIAPLLVQGGKYYRSAWNLLTSSAVPAIGATPNLQLADLHATDFGRITIGRQLVGAGATDFGDNPDFSATGGSILLGFLIGYDVSLGTTLTNNRVAVSDWNATVAGKFLPGDFDHSNFVDALDIDQLFATTPGAVTPATAKFDVNGDGFIVNTPAATDSDADYWVTTLKQTRYGDANLDQKVNFDDLLVLAQNYSLPGTGWATADFNGVDGINFDDLLMLAQNYGFGATGLVGNFDADWALAQSIVPEPTSIALVGSVAALVARRRR